MSIQSRNTTKKKQTEWCSIPGRILNKLDRMPLGWMVIVLLAAGLYYYIRLGKNCVFEINDQLDETLFTYVLNAKYLFSGVHSYPELLGGVPTGGMMVSAWIFVPLYAVFTTFQAFMIQFAIVMLTAYIGMYASVKELTGSSILAFLCGAMFMFLPYQPVYGLSVVGGPMILYAFLCLLKKKRLVLSYLLILYFVLGAHLVLLGYVVLGFVFLADLILLSQSLRNRKKQIRNKPEYLAFYLGSLELLAAYCIVNYELFAELIFPNKTFVSHREEMIISGSGFSSAWDVFWHSGQHAVSLHQYLIIPIAALLIIYGFCFRKMTKELKINYLLVLGIFILNILVALFYGFCESAMVVDWRNSVSGFFHYFAAYRVYWIYPTTWYLAAALSLNLIRRFHPAKWPTLVSWLLIGAVLLPTAWNVRQNSNWILNKSQYKNHCNVGLMSWSDYFAEDVMKQIKDYIGADQSTYKVASLGMCPATALEAGFYCIDGYSNNYSMEYKHTFRKIIAAELNKCSAMKSYFDGWGSRCYLFTAESQNYYYLKKDSGFQYKTLDLDTSAMKALGCRYLFSAAEITDADRMHLKLEKTFQTQNSYYEVWLYSLE